jgi:2-oxo-4-hydroxy-4-carboxy-5-ureidoimidazoline decarboxylase
MDALKHANAQAPEQAAAELLRCCGSSRWAKAMTQGRPFASSQALLAAADREWWRLGREDWLEAFRHHPKIGDKDALRVRFEATRAWAASEQGGVSAADEKTLDALDAGNREYEARFGWIFIVCATGKTAAEMLALLRARLENAPDDELRIAAAEQAKITRIRLEKLLAEVTP